MQKVLLQPIFLVLIIFFLNNDAFASNWAEIKVLPNGKSIYSSPTGATYVAESGKFNYAARGSQFVGSSTINAPVVSAQTGARSATTVKATVTVGLNKREVMAEVLEKAKIGGKALGKGAASAGRFAVGANPYGRAFSLALAALEGSKYFWSDEKSDFVKEKDDSTYIVFVTPEYALGGVGRSLDEKGYKEFCDRVKGGCKMLGFTKSAEAGQAKGLEYCKTVTFKDDRPGAKTYYGDSLGTYNTCATQGGFWVSNQKIHVAKWVDYMPITEDEFFKESEPEADAEPTQWVNTSGVQPTDEPKVNVPKGTVAQTNPYTDPKDGKPKQTRWEWDDKDGDGDTEVTETTIERPDLPPNSPEAPELKPPTDTDTGDDTGTGDKNKPETASAPQPDLCEKNPDIMACDKQPEKPELDEFPEIPTEEVNLRFHPDSVFPNAGQCPAPISFQAMGGTYEISTQPICDIAIKMRPFIIALAYLAAAFFVIRTIKSETA